MPLNCGPRYLAALVRPATKTRAVTMRAGKSHQGCVAPINCTFSAGIKRANNITIVSRMNRAGNNDNETAFHAAVEAEKAVNASMLLSHQGIFFAVRMYTSANMHTQA